VNDFNLSQALRDILFPAVMMAFVLLGTFMTSAHAEVLSPNGVSMSPAEWGEKSPDKAAVTVKAALSNADNATIVSAIPSSSSTTLNLIGSGGGIWWSEGDGAEIKLNIINGSGSQIGSCTVSSTKGKNGKYVTEC
tara:strand:+ start:19975 stop:20382 length:408 start_codon:yes stop_codon:yes gene_type:complete